MKYGVCTIRLLETFSPPNNGETPQINGNIISVLLSLLMPMDK